MLSSTVSDPYTKITCILFTRINSKKINEGAHQFSNLGRFSKGFYFPSVISSINFREDEQQNRTRDGGNDDDNDIYLYSSYVFQVLSVSSFI